MIPNFTFSTLDASRRDASTGLVDWMLVRKGAGVLLSLFGYNSGAQQWLQLFDHNAEVTGSITDTDATTGDITDAGHGLTTGQAISLTGITGLTTGYVFVSTTSVFRVYNTFANALPGGEGGLIVPDDDDDTGTWALLPLHTFAIGAADNFSVIVPRTGINFSKGLVVAVSTTGPLHTAGAKEVTLLGTLLA